MLRKRGDAETRGEFELKAPAAIEFVSGYSVANTFSNCAGQFSACVRKYNYELIATIARHRISVANRGEDYTGHFHQHMRANQVSMNVVDALKIIQVEEQGRYTSAITTGAANLVEQKLPEVAGIV